MKVYEEVVEFIAAGTSPTGVVAFQPSAEVRARVADLIARAKAMGLPAAEQVELDHYLQLEHLMRLAKARARQYIADTRIHFPAVGC